MAKKSKKKFKLFHALAAVLVLILMLGGIVSLLAIDINGGVGFEATLLVNNKPNGIGTIYKGLGAFFGGETEVGSYGILAGEVSTVAYSGIKATLNANTSGVIGLILFVVGGFSFFLLKKNKVGSLLASMFLISGSVLLITAGLTFPQFNSDVLKELSKYKEIHFFDNGAMVAGIIAAGSSLVAILNTIICFIKK